MQFGFSDRFKKIKQKIDQIVTGRGRIDEDLFEELEILLIQADVNVHTTQIVLEDLRTAVQDERMETIGQVTARLKARLVTVLQAGAGPDGNRLKVAEHGPTLYLIVGVNG